MIRKVKKLYDEGFSIIFLHPRTKRPIENGWTKLPNRLWAEHEKLYVKGQNIGVRLGKHSQLVDRHYLAVIDCDVKSTDKKHLKEMEARLATLGLDLKHAPTVVSGRGNGSRHIYVKTKEPAFDVKVGQSAEIVKVHLPSAAPNKREKEELSPKELEKGTRLRAAWEISVMGEGRQVVLPPSIHPDSGLAYRWETPFALALTPILNLEKLPKPEKQEKERLGDFKAVAVDIFDERFGAELSDMILLGKGVTDRSASLFSAAMSMLRRKFSRDEILSVLTDRDNYLGEVAFEHTKSDSRKKAAEWINNYTLKKAEHEVSAAKDFEDEAVVSELSDEEAAAQSEELLGVGEQRLPDKTQHGKAKPTLFNTIWVFKNNDDLGPVIGRDDFKNRVVFLEDTPYGGIKGRELGDDSDRALRIWLREHYGFEPSKDTCFDAHQYIGAQNAFHPVREWLSGLRWDGKSRLGSWLTRGLGAVGPREYVEAVARKTLVAACKRVFEPGCKFDYVLILEGPQGRGKSSALSALAGEGWFTDNIGDISNKDVVDQIQGKWIIELGELASVRKSEAEPVKAFVSRQVDRARLAYGRRAEDYPRQCIFIGTTNAQEYLHDETGNRRFWPVKISQNDFDWIAKNREQLWAEAYELYLMGEPLYLTPEIEEIAKREQAKRYGKDEWHFEALEVIKKWDEKEQGPITNKGLLEGVIGVTGRHPDLRESLRLGKLMRTLGYEKRVIRWGDKLVNGWQKPKNGQM